MNAQLFASVDRYISDLLAGEDDVLRRVNARNEAGGLPAIAITPSQGKFLQLLAQMTGARRILEVGTLGGYSTIWLARALAPGGKLLTLEFDAHHAQVARKNFEEAGLADTIELREGRGLDLLPGLIAEGAEPFDFIFVDADKPPYPEYFELCLQLARPGALMVFDNVIREGAVLDPHHPDERVQGVRRLNELIANHPRVSATILQTVGAKEWDGMALTLVR